MGLQNGNVIYQCYPRTFADGNGDGIGDFIGIEQRLPYLQWLGVNGLWLSPFHESPGKDGGYDVSDYLAVNEALHGSQEQFNGMVQSATAHDIDIISDFVPSHSSDQHPYFQAALQDPNSNAYIFREAKRQNDVPTNWQSVFPKRTFNASTQTYDMQPDSAWRKVGNIWPHAHPARLDQYCLTSFGAFQPNWNHASASVRLYLQAAIRSGLAAGIKGFRLDAIDYMDHDRDYRDEAVNTQYKPNQNPYDQLLRQRSMRGPKATQYLRQLLSVLNEYPDSYAMLETYPDRNISGSDPVQHYLKYYREFGDMWPGRVAPFCFEITDLPWDAQQYSQAINGFLKALRPQDVPIFPSGNHDKDRIASRYGIKAARAAAVLQLTLPGVAVIYQGDELGTTNHRGIPRDKRTDPYLERDVARSPLAMHDKDAGAGYSTAAPEHFLLPIHPDYREYNVRHQQQETSSTLMLYKKLIAGRRERVMQHGDYEQITTGSSDIFAFARTSHGRQECAITVANFSKQSRTVHLGDLASRCHITISSQVREHDVSITTTFTLKPEEAVVLRPTA